MVPDITREELEAAATGLAAWTDETLRNLLGVESVDHLHPWQRCLFVPPLDWEPPTPSRMVLVARSDLVGLDLLTTLGPPFQIKVVAVDQPAPVPPEVWLLDIDLIEWAADRIVSGTATSMKAIAGKPSDDESTHHTHQRPWPHRRTV